jgi:hypothetical protein
MQIMKNINLHFSHFGKIIFFLCKTVRSIIYLIVTSNYFVNWQVYPSIIRPQNATAHKCQSPR